MAKLVAVVDDDISVRRSLDRLIRTVRLDVSVFATADEFLASDHRRKVDCLILDVCLPGMSGIELHRHLLASRFDVPVIFITAHESDDRARSEAASDWTVAYFTKPFCGDELLDAVGMALKWKSGDQRNY
ncbi:MAG: response regulator [Acidobacteriaceae bacterium]|nr:response regulator [Acidobacteriaceae bacterium]